MSNIHTKIIWHIILNEYETLWMYIRQKFCWSSEFIKKSYKRTDFDLSDWCILFFLKTLSEYELHLTSVIGMIQKIRFKSTENPTTILKYYTHIDTETGVQPMKWLLSFDNHSHIWCDRYRNNIQFVLPFSRIIQSIILVISISISVT